MRMPLPSLPQVQEEGKTELERLEAAVVWICEQEGK